MLSTIIISGHQNNSHLLAGGLRFIWLNCISCTSTRALDLCPRSCVHCAPADRMLGSSKWIGYGINIPNTNCVVAWRVVLRCLRENGVVHYSRDRELHSNFTDPAHLPGRRLFCLLGGQSLWITAALCQLPAPDIRGECLLQPQLSVYRHAFILGQTRLELRPLHLLSCWMPKQLEKCIAVDTGRIKRTNRRHHQINLWMKITP